MSAPWRWRGESRPGFLSGRRVFVVVDGSPLSADRYAAPQYEPNNNDTRTSSWVAANAERLKRAPPSGARLSISPLSDHGMIPGWGPSQISARPSQATNPIGCAAWPRPARLRHSVGIFGAQRIVDISGGWRPNVWSLARNLGRLVPKAANPPASLCSMIFQYPKFCLPSVQRKYAHAGFSCPRTSTRR
jgi:hypothetical protein